MSEEVLERQKQFLKVAIGEARQREFTRIKKLQNITSQAQRDVLDARFEAERALDQSRIQNLTQEFEVMKSKVGSGDLQSWGALRAEVPQHLRKMNKHQPYRFAGVENYEQIVSNSMLFEGILINCGRSFTRMSSESSTSKPLSSSTREILSSTIRTRSNARFVVAACDCVC